MANVSKDATNVRRVANTVTSALMTHKERVTREVADLLFNKEPDEPITTEEFVDALADRLIVRTDLVTQAATGVIRETEDDKEASQKEAMAVGAVREELISQRLYVDGTCGAGTSDKFGYSGATPRTATLLESAVDTVLQELRTRQMPPPRKNRPPIDPHELADTLEELKAKMVAVHQENLKETRETQAARSDRNRARSEWSVEYRGIANVAVGLFQLAREHELADRIRPTSSRRKGVPEAEDLKEEEVKQVVVDEEEAKTEPTQV